MISWQTAGCLAFSISGTISVSSISGVIGPIHLKRMMPSLSTMKVSGTP